MTLMEMLKSGSVFDLIAMAAIFILMIFLITRIGKGVEARFATDKDAPQVSAAARTHDGTIAAITAAVKQYRKNK
jgi:Na+-transporting methylmalonyl-CoA/oxaloacetate decarboxylase gamma subunit